ncbi:MAG: hypothetical protein KJN62_03810 [Deltaproteobacteria bacterium]|nr:hypothetical protein [Deltaproteobacteria bacterium]
MFIFGMAIAAVCGPTLQDSVGAVGVQLYAFAGKFGMEAMVGTAVSLLGAIVFRVIQIVLQKLPTKWKWVNNKLTLGFVNRLLSRAFGKTTMIYNAQIKSSAIDGVASERRRQEELKKVAIKHLSRNGGIMQAFEAAMSQK